jgi:protein SCO1/2
VKKINIKNDKKIKIYFVTLDPNRDSPKIMKNYLSSLNDSIIGLTGDSKEIQRLAKSLNVKHIKKTLLNFI